MAVVHSAPTHRRAANSPRAACIEHQPQPDPAAEASCIAGMCSSGAEGPDIRDGNAVLVLRPWPGGEHPAPLDACNHGDVAGLDQIIEDRLARVLNPCPRLKFGFVTGPGIAVHVHDLGAARQPGRRTSHACPQPDLVADASGIAGSAPPTVGQMGTEEALSGLVFHDAEVVALRLDRKGPTLDLDVVTVLPPGKGAFVELRFNGVSAIELGGFNEQNVLSDLVATQQDGRWHIRIWGSYGVEGGFQCSSVARVA